MESMHRWLHGLIPITISLYEKTKTDKRQKKQRNQLMLNFSVNVDLMSFNSMIFYHTIILYVVCRESDCHKVKVNPNTIT